MYIHVHVSQLTCAQVMLNCAVAKQRRLQKPVVCSIKQSATDGFHIPTGYENLDALIHVIVSTTCSKSSPADNSCDVLESLNCNGTNVPIVYIVN